MLLFFILFRYSKVRRVKCQIPVSYTHLDVYKRQIYERDCDRVLEITQYDGKKITISSHFLNKTPLKEFLEIMKDYNSSEITRQSVEVEKIENVGAQAGGLGVGAFKTVNSQYEEEKFHARQGHGFTAERANTLYDNCLLYTSRCV